MSVPEVVLVFAGIPIAVSITVTVVIFTTTPRYRPGRPFAFTAVWYLASSHVPIDIDATSPNTRALLAPPSPALEVLSDPDNADAVPDTCGGVGATW